MSEQEGDGEGEGHCKTAAGGLLHHVYHECLFSSPSHDSTTL